MDGEIKRKSLDVLSFSQLFFSDQRFKVWALKHFQDMMSCFSLYHVLGQITRHFCLDTVPTKLLGTPPYFQCILMALRVLENCNNS